VSRAGPIAIQDDDSVSAGQWAYERLKRLIISVELAPGASLSEGGIMSQIGVGRTPLREALRRLSDEGFVTIYPRRGLVVRQLGLTDAQQVFDSRAVVEPANAGAAARFVDEAGWNELERLATTVERAEQAGDFRAFMDSDMALHLAIAQIGGNSLLIAFTDRLLSLAAWLWFTHLERYGIQASDYAPHAEILGAIANRDSEQAAEAMSHHIQRSRELLRLAL
jgi:DNA-binding GntR family transcriptional regulator